LRIETEQHHFFKQKIAIALILSNSDRYFLQLFAPKMKEGFRGIAYGTLRERKPLS
jgi:hypothetical protein